MARNEVKDAKAVAAAKKAGPKAKPQPAKGAQPEGPPADPDAPQSTGDRLNEWIRIEGPWWASSFVFHMLLMCVLMLLGSGTANQDEGAAPDFVADQEHEQKTEEPAKVEHVEVGETPIDNAVLDSEHLMEAASGDKNAAKGEEKYYDDSPTFEEAGGGIPMAATGPMLGGMGGPDIKAIGPGPLVRGGGGVGVGIGTGTTAGVGGSAAGFGGRGKGHRSMVGGFGGTKGTERAVMAALSWLARHQSPDGNWSLNGYTKLCKDGSCTGAGSAESDPGATAMGLLPFLAAGQTPKSKDYGQTVYKAIYWLMRNQDPKTGNLAKGVGQPMYSHGLCSIAMCEAYALTNKDPTIGRAAQLAINFIVSAQNKNTGGWRYTPGEDGDTSVVGWQVMSLKSGLMAGLSVPEASLAGAKNWLKSCSKGYGGQFSYRPDSGATPCMSAVGLLCSQYMGAQRNDPGIEEGTKLLMANTPDKGARNLYYWYYATQVMHNMPGYEWDDWNRKMRRTLIDTQCKEKGSCAEGSWSPDEPSKDAWGGQGGRVFCTSLACLTLEVYYRYLPLFKQLDVADAAAGGGAAEKLGDKKAAEKTP
jgi:hypothetical protein